MKGHWLDTVQTLPTSAAWICAIALPTDTTLPFSGSLTRCWWQRGLPLPRNSATIMSFFQPMELERPCKALIYKGWRTCIGRAFIPFLSFTLSLSCFARPFLDGYSQMVCRERMRPMAGRPFSRTRISVYYWAAELVPNLTLPSHPSPSETCVQLTQWYNMRSAGSTLF